MAMGNISIRKMARRDKAIVLKIVSESKYLEIPPRRVNHYLKETEYLPFAIELEGVAIGFSIIKKNCPQPKILTINALALKKEYRHKGIGMKSLNMIIGMARKEFGIRVVRVKIEPGNKQAIAYIKKAGFKEEKIGGKGEFVKIID